MRFFGMGIFGKSLAGAGYVVLNGIRVVNIVALLAVVAASSVMLVKTFIVSKFFFFDACEHVIVAAISCFLILTELPLFKSFFARNWPLFSPVHGFVMLGVSMVFLGISLLGNLNKQATSQSSLGLAFWRLVIAAGIIILTMGAVNIIASYIFRDTKRGVTARHVRSHGAVAPHRADVEKTATPNPNRRTRYRSFFLGQKRNSLPSYYSHAKSGSGNSGNTETPKKFGVSGSPTSPGGASSNYSQATASPLHERYGRPGGYGGMKGPELAHHPAMKFGQAI